VIPPRYIQPDTKKPGGLRCGLCPHSCFLRDGETGKCAVRGSAGGQPVLSCYARLSALAVDPIEKKPLYHFFPGRTIVSAGFFGCNLRCPFCQNYQISQEFRSGGAKTPPEELVALALRENSLGIAYTYSEPLVHFEYLSETARQARSKGLKNVLVSNGYLNKEPAEELLPLFDAANIDLKSFSGGFYREELGGSLEPVLRFIELAAAALHLEITTLIIPGKNDSPGEMAEISAFLAALNQDIPLHLSCYYPRYKYTVSSSTYEDLAPLLEAARKKLNYVYPGNVARESNTLCPGCGELLIRRRGYAVQTRGLKNGECPRCGRKIFGVFCE
jgi:pyruvate formate lyase activating enzyme